MEYHKYDIRMAYTICNSEPKAVTQYDCEPITASVGGWAAADCGRFATSLSGALFAVRDASCHSIDASLFGGKDTTEMATNFLLDCVSREERPPYGYWYFSPESVADGIDTEYAEKRVALDQLVVAAREYLRVCRAHNEKHPAHSF